MAALNLPAPLISPLLARIVLSPVAVVVLSLATRASLDKLLALQPDMTLIAYLAQAQALFDMTAAVALAGIGPGVAVFAARREGDDYVLMRDALIWSLGLSACAAIALLALTPAMNVWFGREIAPAGTAGALAIASGLLCTIPGVVGSKWSGRRERGKLIVLNLVGWAPLAVAASGLFYQVSAQVFLLVQLVTLVVIGAALCAPLLRTALTRPAGGPSWKESPLKRYILAGLSIGVMSPASVLWSRAELARGLSWDEVSQLQALWRTSEWVIGLAGSVVALVYLPRMSASTDRREFLGHVRHTWIWLCIPGAFALAALWATQDVFIPLLYTDKFIMPAAASGLFLLGDAFRLASWVPMQGMFATERTKAIAIGEWLSLPLFAGLLTVLSVKSLVVAGACYAATYAIYLAFNSWSVYCTPGRYKAAPAPDLAASGSPAAAA